jgi:hypothetical protein
MDVFSRTIYFRTEAERDAYVQPAPVDPEPVVAKKVVRNPRAK